MGNLSYHVPTVNQNDIDNKEVICQVINDACPQYEAKAKDNMVVVSYKDEECMGVFFNEDLYLLKYKRDIDFLEEKGEQDLADDLKNLRKLKPDLKNCISTNYPSYIGRKLDMKNDVDFAIKDYFKSYVFDEGIHPIYMSPSYERQDETSFDKISIWRKIGLLFIILYLFITEGIKEIYYNIKKYLEENVNNS